MYKLLYNIFVVPPIYVVGIIWVIIHWAATKIYSEQCSGNTILKVIWSPIISQTPPCKGLLWLINTSSEAMKHIWLFAGSYTIGKIVKYLKYKF